MAMNFNLFDKSVRLVPRKDLVMKLIAEHFNRGPIPNTFYTPGCVFWGEDPGPYAAEDPLLLFKNFLRKYAAILEDRSNLEWVKSVTIYKRRSGISNRLLVDLSKTVEASLPSRAFLERIEEHILSSWKSGIESSFTSPETWSPDAASSIKNLRAVIEVNQVGDESVTSSLIGEGLPAIHLLELQAQFMNLTPSTMLVRPPRDHARKIMEAHPGVGDQPIIILDLGRLGWLDIRLISPSLTVSYGEDLNPGSKTSIISMRELQAIKGVDHSSDGHYAIIKDFSTGFCAPDLTVMGFPLLSSSIGHRIEFHDLDPTHPTRMEELPLFRFHPEWVSRC